jgi:hypothetical protein
MKFKIGDLVRIKKFSEEEFKKIYGETYSYNFGYENYLNIYAEDFHKIGEITDIDDREFRIEFQTDWDWFYSEELEKVYGLPEKIKMLKELMR